MITILIFGDIVGEVGRKALSRFLQNEKEKILPDLIVVNGENVSGGIGINPKNARELFDLGVDVITSGNHIWKHKEIIDYINITPNLLRPMNYGEKAPGKGFISYTKNSKKFLILNLLGQIFMDPIYPPLPFFDNFYNNNKELFDDADCVILDFHAEATSEKIACGYFLIDRVNLVFGSHTHVQTADEKLLSDKTAYITDIGMTGPYESVIGVQTDIILEKLTTMLPKSYKVASGDGLINGLIFRFDDITKKVISIERINEKLIMVKEKEDADKNKII